MKLYWEGTCIKIEIRNKQEIFFFEAVLCGQPL